MTEGSQSMSTWGFFLKNYRPQTEPDSIAFFCSQFMIAFLSAFELKPKKKRVTKLHSNCRPLGSIHSNGIFFSRKPSAIDLKKNRPLFETNQWMILNSWFFFWHQKPPGKITWSHPIEPSIKILSRGVYSTAVVSQKSLPTERSLESQSLPPFCFLLQPARTPWWVPTGCVFIQRDPQSARHVLYHLFNSNMFQSVFEFPLVPLMLALVLKHVFQTWILSGFIIHFSITHCPMLWWSLIKLETIRPNENSTRSRWTHVSLSSNRLEA